MPHDELRRWSTFKNWLINMTDPGFSWMYVSAFASVLLSAVAWQSGQNWADSFGSQIPSLLHCATIVSIQRHTNRQVQHCAVTYRLVLGDREARRLRRGAVHGAVCLRLPRP